MTKKIIILIVRKKTERKKGKQPRKIYLRIVLKDSLTACSSGRFSKI